MAAGPGLSWGWCWPAVEWGQVLGCLAVGPGGTRGWTLSASGRAWSRDGRLGSEGAKAGTGSLVGVAVSRAPGCQD